MKLITHDGKFHLDDVASTVMLTHVFGDQITRIVRTRDVPSFYTDGDIVYDVGLQFNPNKGYFDHHQAEGAGYSMCGDTKVPKSSCGLIWDHYGRLYVEHILNHHNLDEQHLDYVYQRMTAQFTQIADAFDNGVIIDSPSHLHLAAVVEGFYSPFGSIHTHRLLPLMNERNLTNSQFLQAYDMVVSVMENMVFRSYDEAIALHIIQQGTMLEEGRILVLSQKTAWTQHIIDHYPNVQFVIYPFHKELDVIYNISTVPIQVGSFDNRCSLHPGLGAQTTEVVKQQFGIDGFIFTHKALFCGANTTLEGAVAMATLSLES